MTPLQKALKEKAVLERALEMACKELRIKTNCAYEKCKAMPKNGEQFPCEKDGCIKILQAHFKVKAKGGR